MKNIYKKIARKIFINAFYEELSSISTDIRQSNTNWRNITVLKSYAIEYKTIGRMDVLKRLDLLS
jgi:hypothetical protein